ncbi:MAG: cellulase family glycosylhydrolase [Fibrobacter sp.]|nr:cellulase family glycosylhydrolase [Fibrobacter sp.]
MMLKKLLMGVIAGAIGVIASPISEHGQLSLKGFDVVDKNGQPYILRGMSFFWDDWGFEKFFTEGSVKTIANDWGGNVVRTPIHDLNESRAKSMIDYAAAAGIYIIVDYHSHCAHKNASGAQTFFGNISSYVKQKNYNHVLYELYNEPLYENCSSASDTYAGGSLTSWNTIKSYAESVIPKIRANDPNGIIIVGTPNYSQGTEAARANPITGQKNIAYTLHFYASTSGHGSLRYNLLRGKCNDFPIIITEWGVSESSGDGNFTKSMNDTWISWIESIGVSWANWSISDKGETSAALTGGASASGGWNDGNLTASGKYVKNLIKNLNAGKGLSGVGLSPANVDCSQLEGGGQHEFVRNGVGSFGYAVQGENYMDSSNVKTVEYEKAQNKSYLASQNSGTESWAEYTLMDIPASGYYVLYASVASNSSGYLHYSVDEGSTVDSVEYSSTGSQTKFTGVLGKIALPVEGSANIRISWKGDLSLDVFTVMPADSSDSVQLDIKPGDKVMQLGSAKTSMLEQFRFDVKNRSFVIPEGYERLSLFSVKGRKVYSVDVQGKANVELDRSVKKGVYMAVLSGAKGRVSLQLKVTE